MPNNPHPDAARDDAPDDTGRADDLLPGDAAVTREITVDADADEVWRFLADPEELAGWVGDEVRGADVSRGDGGLTWTWAPDGVESTVELTLVETEGRTLVQITERRPTGVTAGARACSIGDAWDDRLFGLEVRCLSLSRALIPA